jgi:hypothetical protein
MGGLPFDPAEVAPPAWLTEPHDGPDWLACHVEQPVEKAPQRYAHIDFEPTDAMSRAAARGLDLRREFGRGGTAVGVARARDIKNQRNLSPDTVRRMKSYFDRHRGDRRAEGSEESGRWGDPNNPSAGYVAWLLWGGDPGYAWARRRVREMNAADDEERAPLEWLTRGPQTRADYWRGWVVRTLDPAERRLNRAWARYLSGAARRIAGRLGDVLDRSAGATVRRQWDPRDLEVVMDDAVERTIAARIVGPSVEAAILAGFRDVARLITAADLAWDPTVSPSDRLIGQMIVRVSQYTKARVNDLIVASLAAGDTVAEIQSALILDHAFSPVRALRIARTESTRSVNRGQVIAYDMAADEGINLRIEWLSSRDDAVRPSHEALDGQQILPGGEFQIPIGFENAGSTAPFPGEFEEAGEVVNCRCATRPIVL